MAGELGSVCDYRDWLVGNLDGWRVWRSAHLKEHPGDHRDLQSIEALYVGARDVEALRDDDPRLARIVCLDKAGENAVDNFLEEEHYILARHGFALDGTQTTDGLLSALAKAADDAALLSLDDSVLLEHDAWSTGLVD
jgi:hypothetical protein